MRFAVLGPLNLSNDSGPVVLNAAKQRLLLATLLAHRGEPVSSDSLARMMWGDELPREHRKRLAWHVKKLRAVMDATDRIVWDSRGYMIKVAPGECDVDDFEGMCREAERHPDRAADLLSSALQLWRGAAYVDFPDSVELCAEATRLEELRLFAVERRIEADLACGRHAKLVPELTLQTFLPRMLARGGPAQIVNVASGAGLVASDKVAYVTSKFGVVGLSESLRQHGELTERGIGVTVVCPGFVHTEIMPNSLAHEPGAEHVPGGDRVAAIRDRVFERYGLSPDVVGKQVLRAVRANSLYVHTDRMLAGPVQDRADALLAAMPAETERDRAIASDFETEIAALFGARHGGEAG